MEGYIGEIRLFAASFAPKNWAYCQAQILALQSNTALYSILGTTYGGNGQSTFGLPDLQGRVAIGVGQGPGLQNYALGQKAGTETLSLGIANMPAHTHTATFSGSSAITLNSSLMASTKQATTNIPGTGSPAANTLAAGYYSDGQGGGFPTAAYVNDTPTAQLTGLSVTVATPGTPGSGTVTNALTGGSQPFANMQPFLAMNYIVCMYGMYPSRN
jgi:microcystin-dependent protein